MSDGFDSVFVNLLNALKLEVIIELGKDKKLDPLPKLPAIVKINDSLNKFHYELVSTKDDHVIFTDIRNLEDKLSDLDSLREKKLITAEAYANLKDKLFDLTTVNTPQHTTSNPSFVQFNKFGFDVDSKKMKKGDIYNIDDDDGLFQIKLNDKNNLEIIELDNE